MFFSHKENGLYCYFYYKSNTAYAKIQKNTDIKEK